MTTDLANETDREEFLATLMIKCIKTVSRLTSCRPH
jgi:hypothetical protein